MPADLAPSACQPTCRGSALTLPFYLQATLAADKPRPASPTRLESLPLQGTAPGELPPGVRPAEGGLPAPTRGRKRGSREPRAVGGGDSEVTAVRSPGSPVPPSDVAHG